jgi:hypothetical protein
MARRTSPTKRAAADGQGPAAAPGAPAPAAIIELVERFRRNRDMDADGIPDFADGYNWNSGDSTDDSSTPEGVYADPGLRPAAITAANLPEDTVIHIAYGASDPMGVGLSGSGTLEDPYTYTVPNDGLRLWATNASSRNGDSVWDGGDYLPEGDYTITDAGTTVVDVGSNRTIDLSQLYVEHVGAAAQGAEISVSVSFGTSGSLNASTTALVQRPGPTIIIMPGINNMGEAAMDTIRNLIKDDIQLAEDILNGAPETFYTNLSPSIRIESAIGDTFAYIEQIAKDNWRERFIYGGPRDPIILIGYSDGASCVRNFSRSLADDPRYAGEKIDYVGMIDLVRTQVNLLTDFFASLPDYSLSVDMPDNILAGDNYYQRTWEQFRLSAIFRFPPSFWVGHEVIDPTAIINNYRMATLPDGSHPDHGQMPYIEDVQLGIAEGAADAYIKAMYGA